jgi:hypothetical protein
MRLQPGDRLQLILHRGAKPKESSGFVFDDPTGLIEWASIDRGVITIADANALEGILGSLLVTVVSWMKTT